MLRCQKKSSHSKRVTGWGVLRVPGDSGLVLHRIGCGWDGVNTSQNLEDERKGFKRKDP